MLPDRSVGRVGAAIKFVIASLAAACLVSFTAPVSAQDYAREKRWADQTLAALVVGDEVWLNQKNGHKFLGLYTEAEKSRGAVIVAHGRGWSPDFELYGQLRMMLADSGYTTLSIQMPVLDGTAKLGNYLPIYPDAGERLSLATDWLRQQGHTNVAVVSHSIGASMTNHYLVRTPEHKIDAWVFIGIINGLEDMFRIQIPVLDIFGAKDWENIRNSAGERLEQIVRIKGSRQVIVPDAQHFFEGQEEPLRREIVDFLDGVLSKR